MRWFKHLTNARRDEFIVELQHRWGNDGYVVWFKTIEIVAEQGVKTGPTGTWTAKLTGSPRFFSEEVGIAPEKLDTVYKLMHERGKIKFTKKDGLWTLEWRKVLEFKDEYTGRRVKGGRKKSGRSPDNVPTVAAPFASASASVSVSASKGDGEEGGFGKLCDEFTSLTGRPPLAGVADPMDLSERIKGSIQVRGLEPLLRLMREKVSDCVQRTGRPPSNLQYFAPVFEDGRLFSGRGMNDGAKAIVRKFALSDGELERKVRERIAERERTAADAGAGSGEAAGAPGKPEGECPESAV